MFLFEGNFGMVRLISGTIRTEIRGWEKRERELTKKDCHLDKPAVRQLIFVVSACLDNEHSHLTNKELYELSVVDVSKSSDKLSAYKKWIGGHFPLIICEFEHEYYCETKPRRMEMDAQWTKCAIYLAFLTNFGIPTSECDPRTSVVPPKSFNAVDSTGRNNQVYLPLPSPRMRSSFFTESRSCCSSSFGTLSLPWPPLKVWLNWPHPTNDNPARPPGPLWPKNPLLTW